MEKTYNDVIDKLDMKHIAANSIERIRSPGIYETHGVNLTLKLLFPNEVKIKNTIDNIRLRSILSTIKTVKLTKEIFFLHHLGLYSIPFRLFR